MANQPHKRLGKGAACKKQRPAERSRERAEKAPCAHPTVTKGTAERNSTHSCRKHGIHSRKVGNVPTDTRQNLAMPRTFHCVIYLLGSIRNHSVSQRAFASRHGGKAHGFALYGRHRVAGIKGRLCFIKRKDKRYISNNRNFKQKNIAFLRRKRTSCKNKWTFSRFESCFVFFFSRFSGKSQSLSTLATGSAPRTRRHAPERTRTGASRTQRLCISCLHPSPPHPIL